MELKIKINDRKVYDSLVQFLKALNIEVFSNEESKDEDAEWKNFSSQNLSRAYAQNEPDYTENMVKEQNKNYERR